MVFLTVSGIKRCIEIQLIHLTNLIKLDLKHYEHGITL